MPVHGHLENPYVLNHMITEDECKQSWFTCFHKYFWSKPYSNIWRKILEIRIKRITESRLYGIQNLITFLLIFGCWILKLDCIQGLNNMVAHLPDITGRTALAVRPDVVNAKYHVITNATYNRDPVLAKFKHVMNIDTCTLLCCDYSTLWEALHVNMVEIGARCSDENVKILVSYQWIGWKRRTKMVGE